MPRDIIFHTLCLKAQDKSLLAKWYFTEISNKSWSRIVNLIAHLIDEGHLSWPREKIKNGRNLLRARSIKLSQSKGQWKKWGKANIVLIWPEVKRKWWTRFITPLNIRICFFRNHVWDDPFYRLPCMFGSTYQVYCFAGFQKYHIL